MKKRYFVLAAGMALSLGLVTGCAAKTAETEVPAVEESQEETVEEESTDTGESAEEGESAEAVSGEETSGGSESSDMTGKASDEADTVASETIHIRGTIEAVEDGTMTVDNQSEVSSPGEMIFTIDPEQTLILDAVTGYPVALEDVDLGTFEAYLGPAMTMSLPPQTTPELVLVNIPQDFHAPQYVTARGPVEETELGQTLMTVDGTAFVLTEETEILPYLTRNIVTAADIEEGSRCLFWQNGDGAVEKLILFAR